MCNYVADDCKKLNILPSLGLGFIGHLLFFFDIFSLRTWTNFFDTLFGVQAFIDTLSTKSPAETSLDRNVIITQEAVALNMLMNEFGYEEEQAKEALLKAKGNLEEAVHLLLDFSE